MQVSSINIHDVRLGMRFVNTLLMLLQTYRIKRVWINAKHFLWRHLSKHARKHDLPQTEHITGNFRYHKQRIQHEYCTQFLSGMP